MLDTILNIGTHPLDDTDFQNTCKYTLDKNGVLVLKDFFRPEAVKTVLAEGHNLRKLAYFCSSEHTVYLSPQTSDLPAAHPRNRMVASSKGCITDDQIAANSPLRLLYEDTTFKSFLCAVLNEDVLYPYADPLSSLNLNYAEPGQELGWHFDNSSFSITLMIQKPERGGGFEYIAALRDADKREMNYNGVENVLDGKCRALSLNLDAGDLVLFRGRNAIHRVTPVEGGKTRMLAVLAYNSAPGISLSSSARMAFFGRLE